MRSFCTMLVPAVLASASFAQTVIFDQPLWTGGVARASQLWIDQFGDNDSDLDSLCWDDFTLDRAASVTRVQWWGQTAPSLGFRIEFFNQDPGTIALQPDIFSGPFRSEIHPTVTWLGSNGSMHHYEATLNTPINLAADTRYFLSISGRMPTPSVQWLWSAGGGVQNGTFWWVRADGGRYFTLGENRAMSILTDTCGPDLNSDGVLDFFDVAAFLSAFAAQQPAADWASPTGVFDFFDVVAFLGAFSAGCP